MKTHNNISLYNTITTWSIFLFALFIGTFIVNFWLCHHITYDSDSVALLYSARSIVHGNTFLHGWALPVDNFYFLDQIEFVVGYITAGMSSAVPHIIGPLNYSFATICAIICGTIWQEHRYFTTFIILAFLAQTPCSPVFYFVAYSPWHVLTISSALILFVRDASVREEQAIFLWSKSFVVGFITFSDPLFITIYMIPTIIAGTIIMSKDETFLIGTAKNGLYSVAAMIPGLALAIFLHGFIYIMGGFRTVGENLGIETFSGIKANCINVALSWVTLFHKCQIYKGSWHLAERAALALAVGTALIIIGIFFRNLASIVSIKKRRRIMPQEYLTIVLSIASVTQLAACVTSAQYTWALAGSNPLTSLSAIRYVFPAYLFGVLAVARFASSARTLGEWRIVLLIVIAIAIPQLPFNAVAHNMGARRWQEAGNSGNNARKALLRTLQQKHLMCGYGPYWESYTVGLGSYPRVLVLPVSQVGSAIEPRIWQANAAWYSTRNPCSARFIIRLADQKKRFGGLSNSAIITTFGKPIRKFYVGGYVVYVYRHLRIPRADSALGHP